MRLRQAALAVTLAALAVLPAACGDDEPGVYEFAALDTTVIVF